MLETRILEFKQDITNTFLKTVSAFANYDGGKILFGVDDNGREVGLKNPRAACLDIENKINDSITPQPSYTISVEESTGVVVLEVYPGRSKPFLYKAKAYKRNGTATIEADSLELTRLVLMGRNIDFEELPSDNHQLTFKTLEKMLKEKVGIEALTPDVLKTLNLLSQEQGYNKAAEILSEENGFPGIDAVKFGENISIIQKRLTLDGESMLSMFSRMTELFRDYYCHEEIKGTERLTVERIPQDACREALANAIIHRAYDVNAKIRVLMFDDRLEIYSPGGLPMGVREEDYLNGRLSVLRNPILANVFLRLRLVEIFGTGIRRIKEDYANSITKPQFEITENCIKVVLPTLETDLGLSEDEAEVYRQLSKVRAKSIGEICQGVTFGKSKISQLLKLMEERQLVKIEGRGRGTKYRLM